MSADPSPTQPKPERGRLREVFRRRLLTRIHRQPPTGLSGALVPLPVFGGYGSLDGVNLNSNAALLEAMDDEIQAN